MQYKSYSMGVDMPFLGETQTRVYESTSRRWNERIQERLRESVIHFANNPDQIDARLRELDREWDIERILETNASSLMILFLVLGYLFTPWLLIFPVLIGSFLLLHAIQGWCPPVPILRRLGIRTTREIDHERYALKALRGDFAGLHDGSVAATSPDQRALAAMTAAT